MGKISNALTMMQLLSTGRKYSIDELSKKIEVTPRMIRIYKEELDKMGIYIDTIRGPYGGYVLNQNIRIPQRKFNNNDVKLLNKIIDITSEDLKEDLIILTDKVKGIYLGSREESKELELKGDVLDKYNLMNRAIKEKRKVKILYFSYNKGENERIIRPLDMFLYEEGWGVVAFCEMRKDLRHFDFKRIRCRTH